MNPQSTRYVASAGQPIQQDSSSAQYADGQEASRGGIPVASYLKIVEIGGRQYVFEQIVFKPD
ncbi:MAG: hypothetical protein QXT81_00195 [Candidatus Bathyarchaeia archaeon]